MTHKEFDEPVGKPRSRIRPGESEQGSLNSGLQDVVIGPRGPAGEGVSVQFGRNVGESAGLEPALCDMACTCEDFLASRVPSREVELCPGSARRLGRQSIPGFQTPSLWHLRSNFLGGNDLLFLDAKL